MKLRNIPGPTILDYPDMAKRAVPVVAATGYQTGHDTYDSGNPGSFAWPRVKAQGLGADETSFGDDSKAEKYGFARRINLDENNEN